MGSRHNYKADILLLVVFFTAALGTVFLMDMLKIFSAYKIKKYIQTHNIVWINRIAGVGLVLFGIYLVIRTYLEIGIMEPLPQPLPNWGGESRNIDC